jgi:hypothetical protein
MHFARGLGRAPLLKTMGVAKESRGVMVEKGSYRGRSPGGLVTRSSHTAPPRCRPRRPPGRGAPSGFQPPTSSGYKSVEPGSVI